LIPTSLIGTLIYLLLRLTLLILILIESILSLVGIRVTLIEEAIYNYLIGLELPNPLEPLNIVDNGGNNNSNS